MALDSAELGSLAAAESLGIGIASLSGPLWIARIDRRLRLLVGVALAILPFARRRPASPSISCASPACGWAA